VSKITWVIGVLLLATIARSTEAVRQEPPQFRLSSDFVALDVSVLDRNRRPIPGLVAGDFSILDNGDPQRIEAFRAIDIAPVVEPTAKWMNRSPSDVQDNSLPDGRIVALFMDERSSSADPFYAQMAKKLAHAFVDQLAPNDVAAVTFAVDYRAAQEFTTDRGRLHDAIDRFHASVGGPISVVTALRDLAKHLGALPERRKVIVYVGSGEPFDIDAVSRMKQITMGMGVVPGGDPLPFDDSSVVSAVQREAFTKLVDLFRTAQRANTAIYSLDPIGLAKQSSNPSGIEDDCNLWWVSKPFPCDQLRDFVRMLAVNTGGRAILQTNAPTAEVPAILRENSSYYLLGFRPTTFLEKGRFHRLVVKVNRPNVEVRTRQGYFESQPASASSGVTAPDVAAPSLVPLSEVAIKVSAIPFPAANASSLGDVALVLSVIAPGSDTVSPQRIAVSYSALDMNGHERASEQREFAVTPQGGAAHPLVVHMQALAHLAPGRYDIVVRGQVVETDRRGELFADVTVPDSRKNVASLSGVVIEQIPALLTLPAEALRDFLNRVPTTERTFGKDENVSATIRFYQGPTPVPQSVVLKTVILDGRDRAVFDASDNINMSSLPTRFAEHRLQLPLASLAPGPYLLRFEVAASSSDLQRREVRFEVR
jgi:VWFA-related protein